jgi:hypothetical protein
MRFEGVVIIFNILAFVFDATDIRCFTSTILPTRMTTRAIDMEQTPRSGYVTSLLCRIGWQRRD